MEAGQVGECGLKGAGKEGEQGAKSPGEWRVEDKAWLAGTEGGSEGPARGEVAVGELAGGLLPGEQVEVKIVAAGAAVEEKWKNSKECGERNEEIGKPVALHGERVAQRGQIGRRYHECC